MDEKIKQAEKLCTEIFLIWGFASLNDKDFSQHNEELLKEMFTPRILLKKLEAFGINIVVPDDCLTLIAVCCNENPGQAQLLLKDILLSIKKRKGPIPDGYTITSEDFAYAFPTSFPIMSMPEVEHKFNERWKEQKSSTPDGRYEVNLCDTQKYWKEVMA